MPRGLAIFIFGLLVSITAQSVTPAQHGLLDGRLIDLNSERLPLDGEWHFYQKQLLAPEAVDFKPDVFRAFPELWNDFLSSGQGYATYAVKVLIPADVRELAIEIPQLYCAYELFLNGKLLAHNGRPGTSIEQTIPQWRPQTVSFSNPGDTLSLVLQISNFHHYKGGVKDHLYLGSSDLMQHYRSVAVTGNWLESIVLGVLAVVFFVIYFSTARKKIVIYFALLCLTWAVRVGFSNLYIFITYMPDFNWNLMVRIEYITLFFTMIWAILFLGRVFPKEDNKVIKYLLVGSNSIFIAFAVATQPLAFTRWLTVYLAFSGVLLVYGTFSVLRAWINERLGATYLTISVFLGLLVFSYDVFTFEGYFTYNPLIFSIGYITIFTLMSVVLLLHLNIIKSAPQTSSLLTYEELYKNNDIQIK